MVAEEVGARANGEAGDKGVVCKLCVETLNAGGISLVTTSRTSGAEAGFITNRYDVFGPSKVRDLEAASERLGLLEWDGSPMEEALLLCDGDVGVTICCCDIFAVGVSNLNGESSIGS